MTRRVVVTGMAGLTSLGEDWDSIRENVLAGRSGIRRIDEWAEYDGLNTNVGGPIADFAVPEHYSRKRVPSMGRGSLFSSIKRSASLKNTSVQYPWYFSNSPLCQ